MVRNTRVVGSALVAAMVAPGVWAAPANQNEVSGVLQLRDAELAFAKRAALAEALAMAEADPSIWGTIFKDGAKLLGGLLGSGSSSSHHQQQQQKAHRRAADPINWGKVGHAVKDVGCTVGTFIPGVDVAVDTACLASSAIGALKKHGKREALADPMAEPEAIAEAIALAYAEANPNFADTLMNVEKRTAEAEANWLKTVESVGKKLFHYGPDVINGGNQLYQQTQQPHKRDASPETEANFVSALKPVGKALFHELPNYAMGSNQRRADYEFEGVFARDADFNDFYARDADFDGLYAREALASPEAMAAALAEAFPEADPSIWSSLFKAGGKLLGGLLGSGSSQQKQRRDIEYAYEIFAREADPSIGTILKKLEPVVKGIFHEAPNYISSIGTVVNGANANHQKRDAYAEAVATALAEAAAEADPSIGSLITKAMPYVEKGIKAIFHEAPNYISSIGTVATQAQANKQQQQQQQKQHKREEEFYHGLFVRDPELFSYDSSGYEY